MTGWQEQAEREMWDAAAASDVAPRQYVYQVVVEDTGAMCLQTDDLAAAVARAQQVRGSVVAPDGGIVYRA